MSQISFSTYANARNTGNSTKIGFFKLSNDGDQALVRINCSSVESLTFAAVHKLKTADGKWISVSCLDEEGRGRADHCELCQLASTGSTTVNRAKTSVYIQMLVSYKDVSTGTWSAPLPVVWERPGGFYKELANKISIYGDLRNSLLIITRNGKKGDMKTTYSIDAAPATIFNPSMIPADFSAFDNFNIAKHSYWEKTAEEIHTYAITGNFPQYEKAAANSDNASAAKATGDVVTNEGINVPPQFSNTPAATPAATNYPPQYSNSYQTPQQTYIPPVQPAAQSPYGQPYIPAQAQQTNQQATAASDTASTTQGGFGARSQFEF